MNTIRRLFTPAVLQMIIMVVVIFTTSCDVSKSISNPQSGDERTGTDSIEQNFLELPPQRDSGSDFSAISDDNGPVTITFSDNEYMRSKWAPIIEAFNASQSDVIVQFVPLVDDLLEGIQPDDIASRATKADTTIVWAITDTNAGYLRDLQPLMDIDSQYNPGDFWQAANEGCTDALGNKRGLPTTLVPSLIYYDKQAFELAGIYLPQPGWTWTDFKTTVTQLNQYFSGQRFAFADGPFKSILESFVIENLKQNFGGLDSTRLENDVKWYVELVQQGAIYPVSPDDFSDISNSTYLAWQSPFQSDNPPVIWMGSIKAAYPEFSIDPAAVYMDTSPFTHLTLDRYGVLPLPTGEFNENQNTNPSDAMDCVVMSAGSRNIQASWKWISYLSNFWYEKNDSLLPNQYTAPVKLTLADSQGYWNVLPSSSVASVRFALEHSFDAAKRTIPSCKSSIKLFKVYSMVKTHLITP